VYVVCVVGVLVFMGMLLMLSEECIEELLIDDVGEGTYFNG
jgi:hypothetical protein